MPQTCGGSGGWVCSEGVSESADDCVRAGSAWPSDSGPMLSTPDSYTRTQMKL